MKEFLSRYNVPFETRLLTDERHRRDAQSRGFRASPLTIIGPVEMQGFEPPAMLRVLKEQGVVAPDATPLREAAKRRGLVPQAPLTDALAVACFLDDSLSVLNLRTGGLIGEDLERSAVPLAGHPIAVETARHAGSVAIVNYDGGSVTFLALKDGSYVNGNLESSTVQTGTLPLYAVAHPTEPLLYVSNSETNDVTALDARTGAYAYGTLDQSRFAVPGQPGVMVIHPKTRVLYVRLRDGAVTMLRADDMQPVNGSLERSKFAGGKGRGIVLSHDLETLLIPEALGDVDGFALYDAASGNPRFGTRERSVFPTSPVPFAIASHPTKPIAYLSCFGTRTVEFRDTRTGDYLNGTVESSSFPVGSGARALIVDPTDEVLYVSCFDDGQVMMLDATTGAYRFGTREASTIAVGKGPRGMALLGT